MSSEYEWQNECERHNALVHISELTTALKALAGKCDLGLLAYLLEMARLEAVRELRLTDDSDGAHLVTDIGDSKLKLN
ncbi:MAG: hypothetical protein H6923_08005 [Alphaproteobacteria bacterium]|nr:hypothetical protein [Alphaproteobacteria bacterium]